MTDRLPSQSIYSACSCMTSSCGNSSVGSGTTRCCPSRYDKLVAIHNRLVADYNNLLQTATRNQDAAARERQEAATRIAELERSLTEAEASAEHWRYKWADLMSKKANS